MPLGRIAFILVVIGSAAALSMTSAPKAVSSNDRIGREVKAAIQARMVSLPQESAQQQVAKASNKIEGIKRTYVLQEGESIDVLCNEGISAGDLYLAFPDADSPDSGLYGALYAIDDERLLSIVAPSDEARQTDPRVAELEATVDGSVSECA